MKRILGTLFYATIKTLDASSPRLAAKVVFSLFRRAKRTPLRQVEQSTMTKAARFHVEHDNMKVSGYLWGDKKGNRQTILLIHGWDARASRFHVIVEELLASGYRVIAFDSLGHGESEGDTVTIKDNFEVISKLQSQHGPFEAIVAHSLGSLNAFYAVRNGIAARTLVCISSICEFNYLTHRFASYFKLRERTISLLNERLEREFDNQRIWVEFSADFDPERIESTIHLIHDEDDEFVESEQSKMIDAAYGEKSSLSLTNGLGHYRILSDRSVAKSVVQSVVAGKVGSRIFDDVVTPEVV